LQTKSAIIGETSDYVLFLNTQNIHCMAPGGFIIYQKNCAANIFQRIIS